MQVPLQIIFRHMDASSAVEARIRERCHRLEQFAEHIIRCRITIEAPYEPRHHTGLYQVKISLALKGGEMIVSHDLEQPHEHEDIYVAIRDAIDAVRDQLEECARRRREEIRLHVSMP
ncbi:MAG: HPF/RaiA family ribosome-associated protein [Thiohalomonadales bacterium]|nr:HPF/RaiA family ribosome-associated protein [Thiohalomonadales bacterium]